MGDLYLLSPVRGLVLKVELRFLRCGDALTRNIKSAEVWTSSFLGDEDESSSPFFSFFADEDIISAKDELFEAL